MLSKVTILVSEVNAVTLIDAALYYGEARPYFPGY